MSHFGSALTSPTVARRSPGVLFAMLILAAGAVTGCAKQPGHQDANAALPQPQPSYCQPRPAPDCAFRESTRRTLDPAEFARLKLAYERRCIRRAEKTERARMRELRASGACAGRPAPSLAASR